MGENMEELTQKIISYMKEKYTANNKKWYIGLTDEPKDIKKEFQKSKEIVCEYFKSWPCKNKTQGKKILKELSIFDFTICKKIPATFIFVFLAIGKREHKTWKMLNLLKRADYLILKK